ncbi:Metal-dependent hydrolase [Gammaproteobacteria bacterium]
MSASGVCATSLLVAGVATPPEVALYFTLGAMGGVAPDVDSDGSTPLRISFETLSLLGASFLMFSLGTQLSVAELCLVWLTIFLSLRYGLFHAFNRLTVHRGVFHTIPAAFLSGFLTATISHRLGGVASLQSWIAGAFVTLGYLVHLILDEIYSVNLYGAQIKRSFGTALKIFAPHSPLASLLLYVALVASWQFTPDARPFVNIFTNPQFWQHIETRLLPHNGWFHNFRANSA